MFWKVSELVLPSIPQTVLQLRKDSGTKGCVAWESEGWGGRGVMSHPVWTPHWTASPDHKTELQTRVRKYCHPTILSRHWQQHLAIIYVKLNSLSFLCWNLFSYMTFFHLVLNNLINVWQHSKNTTWLHLSLHFLPVRKRIYWHQTQWEGQASCNIGT